MNTTTTDNMYRDQQEQTIGHDYAGAEIAALAKQSLARWIDEGNTTPEEAAGLEQRLVTTTTCAQCTTAFVQLLEWPRLNTATNRVGAEPMTLATVCRLCDHQQRFKERLEVFKRQFPVAEYYLHHTGQPPRPRQYEATQAWRPCKENRGIVAFGASFTGKTSALLHWCRGAIEREQDVEVVTSADLNTIGERARAGTLRAWLDDITESSVLLLDDVDKARITPTLASELWALLEARLRCSVRVTLVSLNTRSRAKFISMFAGKDGDDARELGRSIFNRLQRHCTFMDFDKESS